MNQPVCCEKFEWIAELDLDHAGGFEFVLGRCVACGAASMNVFCVATGSTGFEGVGSSDVERMKATPAGPELKAVMREWADKNL